MDEKQRVQQLIGELYTEYLHAKFQSDKPGRKDRQRQRRNFKNRYHKEMEDALSQDGCVYTNVRDRAKELLDRPTVNRSCKSLCTASQISSMLVHPDSKKRKTRELRKKKPPMSVTGPNGDPTRVDIRAGKGDIKKGFGLDQRLIPATPLHPGKRIGSVVLNGWSEVTSEDVKDPGYAAKCGLTLKGLAKAYADGYTCAWHLESPMSYGGEQIGSLESAKSDSLGVTWTSHDDIADGHGLR